MMYLFLNIRNNNIINNNLMKLTLMVKMKTETEINFYL